MISYHVDMISYYITSTGRPENTTSREWGGGACGGPCRARPTRRRRNKSFQSSPKIEPALVSPVVPQGQLPRGRMIVAHVPASSTSKEILLKSRTYWIPLNRLVFSS